MSASVQKKASQQRKDALKTDIKRSKVHQDKPTKKKRHPSSDSSQSNSSDYSSEDYSEDETPSAEKGTFSSSSSEGSGDTLPHDSDSDSRSSNSGKSESRFSSISSVTGISRASKASSHSRSKHDRGAGSKISQASRRSVREEHLSELSDNTEDSANSHKFRKLIRKHKQRMETMRHDFPIEAQYPPLQKLLDALNGDGVPLPDATGGCFLAVLVKRGLGRVLKLKRVIGPVGREQKSKWTLADSYDYLWPCSLAAFRALMSEVKARLYASANKKGLGDTWRIRVMEALIKFERVFLNRVDLVNDGSREFHVTKWATLLYYFICVWCRAFAHNTPELLWQDFDLRWQSQFQDLLRIQHGIPKMGMYEAMQLCCYSCPVASCGAVAACAEFCPHCLRGTNLIARSGSVSKNSKGFKTAFQAWSKTQGKHKTLTALKAEFIEHHPEYQSKAPSASEKLSIAAAMAWLVSHQEIIQEPRVGTMF